MTNLLHVSSQNAVTNYDSKITMCSNGYLEIKKYKRTLSRTKDGFELEKESNFKSKIKNKKNTSGEFLMRNLSRSRNTLIEYTCENEKKFNSFITLTLSDNKEQELHTQIDITDIKKANNLFHIWRTQIQRKYPDFSYICVPEYQKRGAVHYHLLTSLRCGIELPARKPKITYNKEKKKYYELIYYDLPYWNYGYSSAYDIHDTDDNFNLALYITKYLYKNIDNRLFGHHKIMKSNDLKKPEKIYCNSDTYNNCLEYIKQKGYKITEFDFEPLADYQIPFKKISTKLNHEDYNIISNSLSSCN